MKCTEKAGRVQAHFPIRNLRTRPWLPVAISVGGGQEPVWGPSLTVGPPVRVFDDPYRLDTASTAGGIANYDVSPDGTRFVMVEEPPASSPAVAPIPKVQVIVNWTVDDQRNRSTGRGILDQRVRQNALTVRSNFSVLISRPERPVHVHALPSHVSM